MKPKHPEENCVDSECPLHPTEPQGQAAESVRKMRWMEAHWKDAEPERVLLLAIQPEKRALIYQPAYQRVRTVNLEILRDIAASPVRQQRLQRPRPAEAPKINVKCVTPDEKGSTYPKIKRIEEEDDGSFTVVLDYWSNP